MFGSRGRARRRRWAVLLALVACVSSCSRLDRTEQADARRYEITGQIVELDPSKGEVRIAHEAVTGFMPAMEMPFSVQDAAMLSGLTPGDLVRADLVVRDREAFLETLERTGHRALPDAVRRPTAAAPDAFLLEGDVLPDATFVDEDGTHLRLRDELGMAVAVTYVYTRCPFPTFCPLIDRQFKAIQDAAADNPTLAGRVRLLSVTLDPEYDTAAVLRAHAGKVGADPQVWRFVRPGDATAAAMTDRLGVTPVRDATDTGVIVHDLVTVVAGADGVVARIYRGNDWRPADVLDLLESLVRQHDAGEQP